MKILKLSIILIFIIGLAACVSSSPKVPETTAKTPFSQQKGQRIVDIVTSMLGKPYRYGGSSPNEGFDCSGLVYFSHSRVGDKVARTSYRQYQSSIRIKLNDLSPGDLLFYTINGKPSHVGVYIGDNTFIHAPSSGKKVMKTSMSNPYFKDKLVKIGRLYQP